MKLLLICGPWGSGTSAVAGLLDHLGAVGLKPYHRLVDDRAPDSYESQAFRSLMLSLALEGECRLRTGADVRVEPELRRFRDQLVNQKLGPVEPNSARPLFLKHPLSALMIPQICRVFDTRLIYVLRPLGNIEATTLRRNWDLGRREAHIIYSHMFDALVEHAFPTSIIHYPQLIASPIEHTQKLMEFAGLRNDVDMVHKAAKFIRTHSSILPDEKTDQA